MSRRWGCFYRGLLGGVTGVVAHGKMTMLNLRLDTQIKHGSTIKVGCPIIVHDEVSKEKEKLL